MIDIQIFDASRKPEAIEKKDIIDFLFTHLEEFGDPWEDIEKAVDYALQEDPTYGGFILTSLHNGEVSGAVVVNRTGMEGYIPENILVYIATHNKLRGQGIGKALMNKAVEHADGNVALHVEPDNPAKFLYEKIGFTSKYLEMRYQKNNQ